MPFTTTDAAALSHGVPTRWLYFQDPTADQFFRVIPWQAVQEQELIVAAVLVAAAGGTTPGFGVWDSDGIALSDDAPTPMAAPPEFGFKRAVRHLKINSRAVEAYGGAGVQVEAQINFNREILVRTLSDTVFSGPAASDAFEGLFSLVHANQTVDADTFGTPPVALTFPMLDDLLERITANGGRPDYLVGNKDFLSAYRQLYTSPATAANPPSTVHDSRTGLTLPSYAGIPILRSDYIQNTGAGDKQTTVYAVCLGQGIGVTMLHPTGVGELGYDVRQWNDDTNSQLHIESSWTCSMAVYRRNAVAKLINAKVLP